MQMIHVAAPTNQQPRCPRMTSRDTQGTPRDRDQTSRDPEKTSRDLFGVQLEVTSLLLEAERRRLILLQAELAVTSQNRTSFSRKQQEQKQLLDSISRITRQHDQLHREYNAAARGAIFCQLGKGIRSQPAIGLKHSLKNRPTIFGTVTGDGCHCHNDGYHSRGSVTAGCHANGSVTAGRHVNGSVAERQSPVKGENGVRRGRSAPVHINGGSPRSSSSDHSSDRVTAHSPEVTARQLHYKNGDLISGSLEELIRHLTPTSSHYPDRAYIFAFLLSARLYIRPHELLQRLANVTKTEATSPEQRSHNAKVATGVLQLLSEWSDTFPYDFRDERVMAQVRVISQRCIQANQELQREVRTVLQNLLDKLTCLEKYEDYVEKLNLEAVKSQNSTNVTDISEVCPSPLVLSQQLTHIELERLSYIGPEEFVQAFAKESPRIDTAYKDLKTTKNLENYIQWFNRLSYMVATEVCMHVKKKQRVRLIEYWIEVGRECFNTGNFNSLMAIIAGLNMSPVSRLKKTWSRVDSSQLSVLEQQMSPSSNFLSYRRTLQAAMWRSSNTGSGSDGRQRIVIPFFSLLVKDLYFLNEGCANRLVDGHINFEKFWQLAKQVTEFIAWKQVTCPFNKEAKVIQYLMTGPVYDEHALWLASYDCEHPENSFEKDRLKVLK